jgi:hypothetical protein
MLRNVAIFKVLGFLILLKCRRFFKVQNKESSTLLEVAESITLLFSTTHKVSVSVVTRCR